MLKNSPDGWNSFFLIQIGQWGKGLPSGLEKQ